MTDKEIAVHAKNYLEKNNKSIIKQDEAIMRAYYYGVKFGLSQNIKK
jgi:phenylalanine-4-hydroxylase